MWVLPAPLILLRAWVRLAWNVIQFEKKQGKVTINKREHYSCNHVTITDR